MVALAWPTTIRTVSRNGQFGAYRAQTPGVGHNGVDFPAPSGTPVVAAAAGTVRRVYTQVLGGKVVLIDHGAGVETEYAHLSRQLVRAGQVVAQGQQIALSGASGVSLGAHLHFGVRVNGAWTDPLPLLGAGATRTIGDPLPKGASGRVPLIREGEQGCTSSAGCCPPGYHRVGGVLGTGLGLFGPDAGVYCEPDELDPLGGAISAVVVGTLLPVGVNLAVVGASVVLIWRGVITILRP